MKQALAIRNLPELIVFSEEFINTVMNEGNTSIILFTNNVNRDQDTAYFKAF